MQKLLAAIAVLIVLTTMPAAAAPAAPSGRVLCSNGSAAGYPCHNVHLLAQLTLGQLGASSAAIKANKHWGWTDPQTGRDYVLFGLTNAVSFIDITERENPVYVGLLSSHQGVSPYRDMAVYGDTLYVVADTPALHGLQVFDLTQLRAVQNPPVAFAESGHYAGFTAGHSLWMNGASGYLYVFRTTGDACQNGVHVVDVQNPGQPSFAGCFGQNDTPLSTGVCTLYDGPDGDYAGRELCFVGSDDNASIFDVTDKGQPARIASFTYPGIARAHQGDLTADRRYWLMSDMMDEHHFGFNTRTYAFDVTDLDQPVVLGHYTHATTAIDHDLQIVGRRVYQANWRAGLRVLDIASLPGLGWRELGYFDTVPGSNSIGHTGAFAPYVWPDGAVTVSDTESGLFVLQPMVDWVYLPVALRQ